LPKHSFTGMNTSKNDTLFSQNLAVIRKKRGFSQDELAKKVGTVAITIGRYERGEIKPSIEIATKIAEALEVSLDYLVGTSDAVLEKSLVQKILAIQQLPDEQKTIVVSLLDAYLRDFQAKKLTLNNMNIFIFGNGNLSFDDYLKYYKEPLLEIFKKNNPHFIVCDFRGTDTLTMELLKSLTPNVTILHIGDKPRYIVDKFKTEVSQWNIKGGFKDDLERDTYAINSCTHFIAFDFNSDEKRKSGTLKNIELCLIKNKIDLKGNLL